MWQEKAVAWLVAVCLLAPKGVCQGNDWAAVIDIRRGTLISVKAWHRQTCVFEEATQEHLILCRRL